MHDMDPLSTQACPLCGNSASVVRYHGPIRAGTFGKQSSEPFQIYECAQCGVSYLWPRPQTDYETEEYRQDYNDSAEISRYFALHDSAQFQYLEIIKNESLRGSVIADFGCGGGAFLDFVRGAAGETIGVEPFTGFHHSLRERGHRVYQYGSDFAADTTAPKVDLAVSLHVIEHVADPTSYLREILSVLSDEGVVYIATPNKRDILLDLTYEAFAPFFYRTAHLWYFDERSLRWVGQAAGFGDIQILFQQNYDLSNAFSWVHSHRPTGLKRLDLFDHQIDSAWKGFLEASGRSDVIWAVLRKQPVRK